MAAHCQAKGELRAAQVEINGLKEEKAALDQALDAKAKEVRMQLLQVHVGNLWEVHQVAAAGRVSCCDCSHTSRRE